MTASAKSATGKADAGRPSDRQNARGSNANPSATIQSTATMATPDVDQGSRKASRTASRSMFRTRAAGLRQADRTTETPSAIEFLPPDSAIFGRLLPRLHDIAIDRRLPKLLKEHFRRKPGAQRICHQVAVSFL